MATSHEGWAYEEARWGMLTPRIQSSLHDKNRIAHVNIFRWAIRVNIVRVGASPMCQTTI